MSEAQGRVGRWLRNKWHLDSLIAIGGMAAVYSSTHRNGARAAIKLLHSQYTRNEQARRRFLAEGYAANKVGHRNAVLVLDDDTTEDGEVYLVMELLDGESLEGRLERVGVLSPTEVLELTDQLLEVLSYAHPKGILHRDIKPANIYLTRDGAVKLLDFGLARVRELSAEAMDQSDGIVFGTVSYIAPEQARADNQNLDARSDLWSIAATMFRALSGETVHPSTGPIIDRLLAVARKPARSIATVCPRLPRPVIELIDRALAFEPEARWPSANVMRVVVQDVLAQLQEEAEEAAAAAETDEPELELQTSVVFGRRSDAPSSTRVKTAPDLPKVRPAGSSPRQKTDPSLTGMRPQSLPLPAAPAAPAAPEQSPDDEVDLDVDALRERPEETRQRRSRTLLTKEGRAELRRILDARKVRDEATPTFSGSAPAAPAAASAMDTSAPAAAESDSADVDLHFDDDVIEVTIDHTRHSRPGPIAEALADPVTPAPVSLPRQDRPERTTGGHPTLGARTEPARATTNSYPALGGTRAPEPPATGPRASVVARGSVPEDSSRAPAGRLDDSVRRPPGALDESTRRRAAAMASLDDTARRRAAAPNAAAGSPAVPEDRQGRTTTASYPTLGGPRSQPFDVSGTRAGERSDGGPKAVSGQIDSGPKAVSGQIDSGPEPVTGEVVTRPAPVVVSGEIVSGPTRAAEITRIGPAPTPASVEVHPTATKPGEITRVGAAPAPPTVRATPEPPRAASVHSGLHETIRPKTIPPVHRPSRPTPVGEPSAPQPNMNSRPTTRPEPAAEGAKKAMLGRAGMFAAPVSRGPTTASPGEPSAARGAPSAAPADAEAQRPKTDPPRPTGSDPPRSPSASSAGAPRPSTEPPRPASASSAGAPRPSTEPPASASPAGAPRPSTEPPRPASASAPRPSTVSPSASLAGAPRPTTDLPRSTTTSRPAGPGEPVTATPGKPIAEAPGEPATPAAAPRASAPAAKSMFNQYPARTPVPAPEPKDIEADETGRFDPKLADLQANVAASKPAAPASGTPGARPGLSRSTPAGSTPAASTPAQPVPKDSPEPAQPALTPAQRAAARASAPTAPQPVVAAPEPEPPARPSTESRAKTGAVPVLPFSFLRPGAAPARPAAPASEPPPSGDTPPRKKP